jgi:hypothetical protein
MGPPLDARIGGVVEVRLAEDGIFGLEKEGCGRVVDDHRARGVAAEERKVLRGKGKEREKG